jgi:hypothetical protein
MPTLPLRLKSVKLTLLSLASEQALQPQQLQALHQRHLMPGLRLAKCKSVKIWHHSTELVDLAHLDHLAKQRLIKTSPLNSVFLLEPHGDPQLL